MKLSLSLALPKNYRCADILAFHQRDKEQIAEQVSKSSLQKGIILGDKPACLTVCFRPGKAETSISIDGTVPQGLKKHIEPMLRRMLGLSQDIDKFERQFKNDSQLGGLISKQTGLRVPMSPTPFEALTWAISGQQISIYAAISLRRNLIRAANIRHSSGLLCYPGPNQILNLSEESLRDSGFSSSKAKTLMNLSELVAYGKLPLDYWLEILPVDLMRERLESVRGIGPWTVNYTLLRGFGWLDGSLHGDVAVRRGLQMLLEKPNPVSEKEAKIWLEAFSPWRALVGAHLWALQTAQD